MPSWAAHRKRWSGCSRAPAVAARDTGVLAGLVTTCRYAGLLDASMAAHQRAVAIDPARVTSVAWTHFMLGDYDAAIQADTGTPPFCALLAQLVTRQVSTDVIREAEQRAWSPGSRLAIGAYRAVFDRQVDEAMGLLDELGASGFDDPEGWYLYAFALAGVDAPAPALVLLARAVDGGYGCHEQLTSQPEWGSVQSDPAFAALVERTANDGRRRAQPLRRHGRRGPALAAAGRTVIKGLMSPPRECDSPHQRDRLRADGRGCRA